MSKELIGEVAPYIPGVPPVLPEIPVSPMPPSKAFLADLKGEKGDPGVVDPAEVAEIVDDYLQDNPVGVYVETFVQSTPSNIWVITHNLPFQPAVTIIDSAGTRIQTEIVYDSPTQIRSLTTAEFSGTAYLS